MRSLTVMMVVRRRLKVLYRLVVIGSPIVGRCTHRWLGLVGTVVVGIADRRTAADRILTVDHIAADRLGTQQLRSSGRILAGHTVAGRILVVVGSADLWMLDRKVVDLDGCRRLLVECSWIRGYTLVERLTSRRLLLVLQTE